MELSLYNVSRVQPRDSCDEESLQEYRAERAVENAVT